jgi:hypothetical protein
MNLVVTSARRTGNSCVAPGGATGLKIKVEMTLTGETARKLKETGERLAGMDLGDDGMLAATVLMRISANYERAVEAAGVELKKPTQAERIIPLENHNAENGKQI